MQDVGLKTSINLYSITVVQQTFQGQHRVGVAFGVDGYIDLWIELVLSPRARDYDLGQTKELEKAKC